jgi:hypothetical protein
MILVDERLLELGKIPPYGGLVALQCALAQTSAYRRWHHLLDMRSEGVWRQLTQAARTGDVSHVRNECISCGVAAALKWWYAVGTRGAVTMAENMLLFPFAAGELIYLMMSECEGERISEEVLKLIGENNELGG